MHISTSVDNNDIDEKDDYRPAPMPSKSPFE